MPCHKALACCRLIVDSNEEAEGVVLLQATVQRASGRAMTLLVQPCAEADVAFAAAQMALSAHFTAILDAASNRGAASVNVRS